MQLAQTAPGSARPHQQLQPWVLRQLNPAPPNRCGIDAGLDAITFAWAGSLERSDGHYYALCGPTFLLEYDNMQDDANHVQSVWRDLRRDWGGDLLAAHYATTRR